jgi:hypothetical protein
LIELSVGEMFSLTSVSEMTRVVVVREVVVVLVEVSVCAKPGNAVRQRIVPAATVNNFSLIIRLPAKAARPSLALGEEFLPVCLAFYHHLWQMSCQQIVLASVRGFNQFHDVISNWGVRTVMPHWEPPPNLLPFGVLSPIRPRGFAIRHMVAQIVPGDAQEPRRSRNVVPALL